MKAYIKAVDYYLPEKILTNKDIAVKFPEWSEEKIFQKVGIKERHISDKNETAVDMAYKAAEKLFANYDIPKEEIDFILFCTQSADYKLPTSACILQNLLGLSKKVGALDFNLGCSGYEYGLSLAKGLITGGMASNVLLLTAETYSKYISPEDKGNISIFGDGATATIVAKDGFAEICNFIFGTDGSGAEDLLVKTGGAKYPIPLNDNSIDENGHIKSSDFLYMDGNSIFSFTLAQVPKMVKQIISDANIQMEDIDLFLFHQANVFILEFLRKKMHIPEDKFFYCIEKVGNTVSNTIPIALTTALRSNTLVDKKNIILAGFGVGLSWSGCLIRII